MNERQLDYLISKVIERMDSFEKLRAVNAFKEGNVIHLTYYFDQPLTEEIKEEASIASGELIAHFPEGFLKEKYISLKTEEPLPESSFWVYVRQT